MITSTFAVLAAAPVAVADGWGHGGGWWWIPFVLLFWVGVAAILAHVFMRIRPSQPQSGVERAKDILAERLARGEITPDEYYERLTSLS